jgi:hypothetical protein
VRLFGAGVNPVYEEICGLYGPGSGRKINYTPRMVRRMVAWQKIGRLTGTHYQINAQRKAATRLLAFATEGYVVMSEGQAWWSLAPPIRAVKETALVFPAIQWQPEHRPR